ncbi:MAG: glycoside hydrolase family 13 protein [Cyclobacteriaceae bacterium]
MFKNTLNSFKIVFLLTFLSFSVLGQKSDVSVEPPFWWSKMPVQEIQLMFNGQGIGKYKAAVDYPGITITKSLTGESPNYLFVYLNISPDAEAGNVPLTFTNGKKKKSFSYELRTRELDPKKYQGFNSTDVIYLLMPDRFANGNPNNDSFDDMLEKADRESPNGRHGGDLKGIQDRLAYIKGAGMTAVWTTPVFENDMPVYEANGAGAYHGYAATDLYAIDKRFGTNQEFKDFVEYCHKNDVKVIMDMIHNHIGVEHPWMKDLPTKDWVHDWDTYGQTNYRGVIVSDPYASQYDLAKLQKGWFVKGMPDLNQRNPLLADYLILNTLWWIEYSGVDGIRMDTYVYPYKDYMARWAKEVLAAYPTFNIVGEAWVENVVHESYWQGDLPAQNDGYDSFLPTVTDFQFMFHMNDAMNTDFGWTTGLRKLYYYLTMDRVYSNPQQNVIFLDNHDTERFFTTIGQDKEKYMMAYAYLMTVRGIPQVYYGTELMFSNINVKGDGRKRPDMPGGWEGDERNVFVESGRTETENEIYDYVAKITKWRKNASAVHYGKTTQFIPEDNLYVFFRHNEEQKIMVIMNMNDEPAKVSREKHIELLRGCTEGFDVMSEQTLDISVDFEVPAKTTTVLELK